MLADASSKRVRGVMLQNENIMEERRRSKEKNLLLLMMRKEHLMIVNLLLLTKKYPLIHENISAEAPVDMEVVECDENVISVSKIIDIELVEEEMVDEEITGYRLLDMSILNNILNSLFCPECLESWTFNLQDFNAK